MRGSLVGFFSSLFFASLAITVAPGIASAQDMPPILAPLSPSGAPAASSVPSRQPGASTQSNPSTQAVPSSRTAVVAPAVVVEPGSAAQSISAVRLDQLVAPVALYPDPLLGHVLMAATYPLEVAEAARWTRAPANRALSGNALTEALKDKHWDPSVMALVAFPRLLSVMVEKLEWTEQLGDAFLSQQSDVLSAVQRLRRQAEVAGNLKVTPQCHCIVRTSGETIEILPAPPQVVGVPVYNPAVVYGAWRDPAYPPVAFPAAARAGAGVGFGPPVELAAFGPLWGWGSVDWTHHRLAVDPGRYALVARSRPALAGGVWVHDPAHRGGIAYADPRVTARFGAARLAAVSRVKHEIVTHSHETAARSHVAAVRQALRRRAPIAAAPGAVAGLPPGYRLPPPAPVYSPYASYAGGPPPWFGSPYRSFGRFY